MFPWQVGGREMPPDTLSQRYRGKWETGRCHLERFRSDTVPGGKRGDATWNTFAGFPCQVDGGKGHLAHFRGISVPGGRQGDAT